jgi:hypothetical protein
MTRIAAKHEALLDDVLEDYTAPKEIVGACPAEAADKIGDRARYGAVANRAHRI